jgi:hypothetical protein
MHSEIYQELVKIAPGIPDEIGPLATQGSLTVSAKVGEFGAIDILLTSYAPVGSWSAWLLHQRHKFYEGQDWPVAHLCTTLQSGQLIDALFQASRL